MNRRYKIGEFAELAGVTVRALHHYDRIGLLKPQRSTSGNRLYSMDELHRLEQVAALKFLGIPLREIKLLLRHGPLTLTDSLHMQREALTEKRRLIDRAIVAIETAEKAIRSGQTTDASILRKIIEVIDMQPQENFMRKYYTEQAWTDRAQLREQWEHAPAETRKRWRQTSQKLFTEIEAALDLDPASEAAQALTKRWLQLVNSTTGGNDGIGAGSIEAWKDRHNWPQDEQDKILAGFGLDPQDRAVSMQRLDAVANFIGRVIGQKVRSSLRSLYGLDQPPSN
jgi:MerR family transcriptional regulator, thiopeptide resistance regulator